METGSYRKRIWFWPHPLTLPGSHRLPCRLREGGRRGLLARLAACGVEMGIRWLQLARVSAGWSCETSLRSSLTSWLSGCSLVAQGLPLQGGQKRPSGDPPCGTPLPAPAQTAPASGAGRKEPLAVCKQQPRPAGILPCSAFPQSGSLWQRQEAGQGSWGQEWAGQSPSASQGCSSRPAGIPLQGYLESDLNSWGRHNPSLIFEGEARLEQKGPEVYPPNAYGPVGHPVTGLEGVTVVGDIFLSDLHPSSLLFPASQFPFGEPPSPLSQVTFPLCSRRRQIAETWLVRVLHPQLPCWSMLPTESEPWDFCWDQ